MFRILTSTLVTFLGLQLAYGGPMTFLQLSQSATVGDNCAAVSKASFDSGILTQPIELGPTFAEMTGSGLGFANARFGKVAAGQIHGFVSAEGTYNGGPCQLQGPSHGNPIIGNGNSQFSGEWVDTLTVGGLPLGTPVMIRVTSVLHADVGLMFAPSGTPGTHADALATLRVLQGGNPFDLKNLDSSDSNPVTLQLTFNDFVFRVGSSFTFEQSLFLNATALASSLNTDVVAIANASNTSNTFIDVLTQGATLSSASGAQYASPSAVPEPATFILVGCGLLVGGIFSRSRHRKAT